MSTRAKGTLVVVVLLGMALCVVGVIWSRDGTPPEAADRGTSSEGVVATAGRSTPARRRERSASTADATSAAVVEHSPKAPPAPPKISAASESLARELHDVKDKSLRLGLLRNMHGRDDPNSRVETLTAWMALNEQEPRVSRASLLMARSVSEYEAGSRDDAVADLLKALLDLQPPLPKTVSLPAGRVPVNLHWLAMSSLLSPAASDGRPGDTWVYDWARIALSSHGRDNTDRYVDWLLTVADDGTHAEAAMAASIWAHAIAYVENTPYFRSITPEQARLMRPEGVPSRSSWTQVEVNGLRASWDEWVSLATRRDDPLVRRLNEALDDARGAGEPESKLLIPWSLEQEVLVRFAEASTPDAGKLRELTRWLVRRERP
jgi:hypothetical protein